jgi:hypothetical protein
VGPGALCPMGVFGLVGRAGSALKRAYDLLLPSLSSPTAGSSGCYSAPPLLLLLASRGRKARQEQEKLATHRSSGRWLAGESAPRLYYSHASSQREQFG